MFETKDVIIIASVSCIYGLGDPIDYENQTISLRPKMKIDRNKILKKLVDMQYVRNELDFKRGTFRAKGDIIDIIPISEHTKGIRIELFGDEIEALKEFDPITGKILTNKKTISLFPASHFVTSEEKLEKAITNIRKELDEQLEFFLNNNKLLEHQRLSERTNYDMEMLEETGFCRGVENYSRHLALKEKGATPTTLMDFFGDDYLLVIDESHVTLPQVRAMYNGDRARKEVLVDYGFRLPSALDNRPLKFHEFENKIKQAIYVSATPGDYEIENSPKPVEQIIRPTGLLDPVIEVHPTKNQIDDLIEEINKRTEVGEKVLITTLTIRMAEELTQYLKGLDIKVAYLHSEVKTLERLKIIRDLRKGKYDVLVGINLLREGLDIPEVSLVAIMDADKQGFLRSERSLIQTIGRAARNAKGTVIMYADSISESMDAAIKETNRRREIQQKYNEDNNIIPKNIIDFVETTKQAQNYVDSLLGQKNVFDNPKPVSLIKHFIQISQMPKDAVILDFFAGSGTTFEAVCQLNNEDSGGRRCILIQKDEKTSKTTNFDTISKLSFARCQKVHEIYNEPIEFFEQC